MWKIKCKTHTRFKSAIIAYTPKQCTTGFYWIEKKHTDQQKARKQNQQQQQQYKQQTDRLYTKTETEKVSTRAAEYDRWVSFSIYFISSRANYVIVNWKLLLLLLFYIHDGWYGVFWCAKHKQKIHAHIYTYLHEYLLAAYFSLSLYTEYALAVRMTYFTCFCNYSLIWFDFLLFEVLISFYTIFFFWGLWFD